MKRSLDNLADVVVIEGDVVVIEEDVVVIEGVVVVIEGDVVGTIDHVVVIDDAAIGPDARDLGHLDSWPEGRETLACREGSVACSL